MKCLSFLGGIFLTFCLSTPCFSREYHVSKVGNDNNVGSQEQPFLTIQRATALAQPGDVITIHEGVYRERVVPVRGGLSDTQRIVYQAAENEQVVISGADRVTGWKKEKNDTWSLTLPNEFFGDENPFDTQLYGSWYHADGRPNHAGIVFLNDERIRETFSLNEVMEPIKDQPRWYVEADGNGGKYLMHLEWVKPSKGTKITSMNASVKGGDQAIGITMHDRWPFAYLKDGSELYFDQMDFGSGSDSLFVQAATLTKGGMIEVHLDSADGESLGTLMVASTGDWEKFKVLPLKLSRSIQGKHDLCLVLKAPAIPIHGETKIWAQFPNGVDPNKENVEITKRSEVFYPAETGINYLTIRGLILEKSATNWAPPSAEQPGLIGTRWSKGWVIEDNVIRHSRCSGIALGRPTFGHAHHYQKMPPRIYADPEGGQTVEQLADFFEHASWDKDAVGYHVIRNNQIYDCGQAGIVGCCGAAFSLIENNEIHDICVGETFRGEEMAGIKFHFAVDLILRNNHIYNTIRGMWIDWGTQGCQVRENLFHDNREQDIFVEVCHGPILLANNIFLSNTSVNLGAQGIACVHNIINGRFYGGRDRCEGCRASFYYPPHETRSLDNVLNVGGDYQVFNNLLTKRERVADWDEPALTVTEKNNSMALQSVRLEEREDGWYLTMDLDKDQLAKTKCKLIKSTDLRKTEISKQAYTNPDGSKFVIDHDFLGKKYNRSRLSPGAIQLNNETSQTWLVWKKQPK